MIKASTDFGAVLAKLDRVEEAARDLREPLARTGGYIRGEAKKRFDEQGPGWQPLAASTQARKLTMNEVRLFQKSKSGKSVARTVLTQARIRERALTAAANTRSVARRAKSLLRGATAEAFLARTAVKYGFGSTDRLLLAINRERERSRRRGAILRATQDMTDLDAKRRLRQSAKQRYRISEQSTKMLGHLRDSMYLYVEGDTVTVRSRTKWAGVHNEGGQAGHGAHIPERKFLEITPADREQFRKYMAEHFDEAWHGK